MHQTEVDTDKTYFVTEHDEQGRVNRIDLLFKTRSEAEWSAAMLAQLHPCCRYQVDQYIQE